jgi:hypothetical protein
MTWLRLDDRFAGHPKISPLTDGAFRLHVSGLLYCAGHETDGLIPLELVPTLMPKYRRHYLTEVADRGLWLIRTELAEIHDFTDYNPTREQQQERRRKNAEKLQKWRASHPDV